MNLLDIDTLVVGQEIGYIRKGGFYDVIMKIGTSKITKINNWGHITLENGKVFDKFGNERNKDRFGCWLARLEYIEEEKASELLKKEKQSLVSSIESVKFKFLDTKTLKQIKEIIDNAREN